ncbi:MAG: alpha/beta hydrolase, partial [Nitrospirae bacterium]|nr:alpha/beta hydrolase [Nitrospirota bacterium]
GGLIAQELAIKYPEVVKSLTLTASYPRLTPIGLERTKLIMRMFQEGVPPEIVVRNFFLWLFTDRFFENEEQFNIAVNGFLNLLSPKVLEGLEGQVQAILHYNGRNRLHQITAPTLVIVGRDDILTPVRCSEELAATIPNARLIVLEDATPSLIFESPEKFNRAALDWLSLL